MSEATPVGSSSSARQGPPAFIEFVISGKRLVRYTRLARSGDVDAAVLGKGGFGCVYRYAIDASFTPPTSMDFAVSLQLASERRHTSDAYSSPSSQYADDPSTSRSRHRQDSAEDKPLVKAPSLVAVKLCRTPCSGSFDELQKTSLIDKKTRRDEMQDSTKMHVRIVRGEGRIFEYLQAAHRASDRSDDPPLVKLLANLSPAGLERGRQQDPMESSLDEDEGPPTRLLVFEKLIEIDAERTAQGWAKSKKTWTHERVEKVAFEVMQGIQFLHEHNVTHGDLKPSNLMLDPRTGVVKIIDLGASRRFVHLSNKERNNRSAVEEQDRWFLERNRPVARLSLELCEGLGSLTGSPYYMAPEILLQATRYVDYSGRARSVLEDYEYDYPSFLPREQWPMYQFALSDLKRGWGIRADIWSWACTVQALLLKTVPEDQRPSSSTISPYDFSFSRHRDEMIDPLHEKSPGEDDVPRFHQWCRVLPLLIVRIALEPIALTPQADGCTSALRSALKECLRHQDLRPTADDILQILQTTRPCSRASLTPHFVGRPYSATDSSPHSSSAHQAGYASPSLASSGHKTSPWGRESGLEPSRYATPSLSYGFSSVSSPQHTCEITGKKPLEEAAVLKQRAQGRTSTADTTFVPALLRESQPRTDVDQTDFDDIPPGFELVSTIRTSKTQRTPLTGSARPVTASATLQPFSDSAHRELVGGIKASRSHPSTPVAAVARATLWETDVRMRPAAQEPSRRQELQASPTRAASVVHRGPQANHADYMSALPTKGLDIKWPVEGVSALQLTSTGCDRHVVLEESVSAPPSPITHSRGASMPLLASTAEHMAAPRLAVPPPVALASPMRVNGADIGGSPRSTIADSKSLVKQGSLMATLRKKQERLKESSRKLMLKRGSEGNEATNASPIGYESRHEHEREQRAPHGTESMDHVGSSRLNKGAGYSNPAMSAMPYQKTSPNSSIRHGASSSRRSANRTEEEPSPSKPLLRRLLAWGSTS